MENAGRRDLRALQGVAALETALFLGILLIFILLGAGLVNYVQKIMLVSHLVDKFIFDQSLKALSFAPDGTLQVDAQRVRDKMPELLRGLQTDLSSALPQRFEASHYLIQSDFAAVDINPQSGASRGLLSFSSSVSSLGQLALPGEILSKADLRRQFEGLSQLPGTPSPLAVPTADLADNGGTRFMPATVLVGIRAFYSLHGTFTGNMITLLGISSDPIVFDSKVVTLRGEVG